MFNYFEDYGYDSCTSRGVCTISPRMASIFEIILLYLREFAYYSLKLQEFNTENENVKNLILNTLSAFVSNPEIPDDIFARVICTYTKELDELKEQYFKLCSEFDKEPEIIDSIIDTEKSCNVISSIRLGEQHFLDKTESPRTHAIQELLFFTAKSITIYLLELNSFGEDSSRTIRMIYELLDSMNIPELSDEDVKSLLINAAEEEYALVKKLANLKSQFYGEPQNVEINLSTTPNKAIMVDGTNIRELKDILEITKKLDIDIYTHGEMLAAHAYPEIKKYNHLKGHYGHGTGNSILDFSTFPGAIFIGRHSIDNIDNLYRGRLFTTDIVVPKGVCKIDDKYDALIEAALDARGFKNGKKQPTQNLFLDKNELKNIINSIDFDDFEGICFITQGNDSYENKNYFEKLLKLLPDDILIINFSSGKDKANIININAAFDLDFVYRTLIEIKSNAAASEKPIIAFTPRCDKHITNLIINLQTLGVKKIFMGKCPAKNINPAVVKTFCELFNISQFSNVKDDYKSFIDYLSL